MIIVMHLYLLRVTVLRQYISDYVLRKAEDTEKFYDDRRISMFVGEKAKKFPKLGKTLPARAIEREGGKKPIIPDKVIIEEYKTNRTVDFDYDMDEITSVRLNDELMARAYKGDTREVFALNAGEKEWYYVSDLRGNYAFDVEKNERQYEGYCTGRQGER